MYEPATGGLSHDESTDPGYVEVGAAGGMDFSDDHDGLVLVL